MPDLETSTTLCTYCPNLCRHACPVSSAEPRETYIPRAKMATLGRLRRGHLELTVENSAALYACTGCGACTEACLHGVEPARALFTGRADAVHIGQAQHALADLPGRVLRRAERAARAVRDGLPHARFPSQAEVALLPACDAPGEAAATLTLLSRLGADHVGVADVTLACGGAPLLAGGQREALRVHAHALARQLQGYARIAVACPACAHAMKNEYPSLGVTLRPEVLHLAEYLGTFVDRLAGVTPLPPAFYHDACYLGRRSGVYEAPRRLLARALASVREFSHNREEAACSGGGGLLPETMPDAADAIADARLDEVVESDVRRVVSACPTCTGRLARRGVSSRSLVAVLEEVTRPTA